MQPWRTGRRPDAELTRGCFNSATAMQPWRTQPIRVILACMKSLQFGHGHAAVENMNAKMQGEYNYGLQFGHGHAAVENSIILFSFDARMRLQFGHGHAAVENGCWS